MQREDNSQDTRPLLVRNWKYAPLLAIAGFGIVYCSKSDWAVRNEANDLMMGFGRAMAMAALFVTFLGLFNSIKWMKNKRNS